MVLPLLLLPLLLVRIPSGAPPPAVTVLQQKLCTASGEYYAHEQVFVRDEWVYALCQRQDGQQTKKLTLNRVALAVFGTSGAAVQVLVLAEPYSVQVTFAHIEPRGDLLVQAMWNDGTASGYSWQRVHLGADWHVAAGPTRTAIDNDAKVAMPVSGSGGGLLAVATTVTFRVLNVSSTRYLDASAPAFLLQNQSGALLSMYDGVLHRWRTPSEGDGSATTMGAVAMFNEFGYRFHAASISNFSSRQRKPALYAQINDVARLPDEAFALWRDGGASAEPRTTLVTRMVDTPDNTSLLTAQVWDLSGIDGPTTVGQPTQYAGLPANMKTGFFCANGFQPARATAAGVVASPSAEAFIVSPQWLVRTWADGTHTMAAPPSGDSGLENWVWYPRDPGVSPPLPHVASDGRYVLRAFNQTWPGADFRWVTVAAVGFAKPSGTARAVGQ